MYLDAHQSSWSWTALYMNSQNVFEVPYISPFLIWHSWHNCENVIVSRGVYYFPHELSFLIWRTRDIYYDTDHKKFYHIFCIFHPEVIILDHFSSCIKVSTLNHIIFIIIIDNINHLSINYFIHVVFSKY